MPYELRVLISVLTVEFTSMCYRTYYLSALCLSLSLPAVCGVSVPVIYPHLYLYILPGDA